MKKKQKVTKEKKYLDVIRKKKSHKLLKMLMCVFQ